MAIYGTMYCILLCKAYICIVIHSNIKEMNVENTQSQMKKGVLEYCILAIIKRGEAYPGDITDEMRAAGMDILEGTLYPLLNRLKNADVLSYRWVESSSGPPRKYFSLTEKGERFYSLLEITWRELSSGVEAVTTNKNNLETNNNTTEQ